MCFDLRKNQWLLLNLESMQSGLPPSNREIVMQFYEIALVSRRPIDGFQRFVSPDFIEHKPQVSNPTREGSAAYLAELMADLPQAEWEIVRTMEEGAFVFLHVRFVPEPGAAPYAIADIFRLEDGLIVEHWDVVAGTPDSSTNPNDRF